MRPKLGSGIGVFALVVLQAFLTGSVEAQSLAAGREYEPVVIEGGWLDLFVQTADITKTRLYKFENGQLVPMPFQIDKRRKVNLGHNLRVPRDAPACEFGYFPELNPLGSPDPFQSNLLHSEDEIVFMLKDAGSSRASAYDWVTGAVARYEIVLRDERTGAKRYVYAFRWTGTPPAPSATDYVTYQADQNPPICQPEARACGTAESVATELPGLTTNRVHFGGGWITDGFQVKNGATPYNDLLGRFEYNTEGDSENGFTVNCNFLGVPLDGTIRIVRGVIGAESGALTSKYEYIYPTQLVSRVNLRVHELIFLEARVGHDAGIVNTDRPQYDAFVWTESRWNATPLDHKPLDVIDGLGCPGCPSYSFSRLDGGALRGPRHLRAPHA